MWHISSFRLLALLLLLLSFTLWVNRSESAVVFSGADSIIVTNPDGPPRTITMRPYNGNVSLNNGGVIANTASPVSVSAGKSLIPVTVSKTVGKAAIKNAGRLLLRANPYLYVASLGLDLYGLYVDSQGQIIGPKPPDEFESYFWKVGYDPCSGTQHCTFDEAVLAYCTRFSYGSGYSHYTFTGSSGTSGGYPYYQIKCHYSGSSNTMNRNIYAFMPSGATSEGVLTDQELENVIDDAITSDPNISGSIYSQAIKNNLDVDGTISSSGPSSITGNQTVKQYTLDDGTPVTETTNETWNITYDGNVVNVSKTINTTIVNNNTGETIKQITEDKDPSPTPTNETQDEKQYYLDYQESDLPPVPDFYSPTYENGFSDVWNSATQGYEETPLISWLQAQTNSLPDSGSCPGWSIPMNLGIANFGDAVIQPPCDIWPWIRAFLLVTALFAARSIIFGG